MAIKKWRRDRVIKRIDEWLASERNRSFVFEEPHAKVAAFASGGTVPPNVVSQRLRSLARWYAAMAVVEAEGNRDEPCARYLYQAHLCDWIGLAMLARRSDGYGENERRVISANDAAFAIARAVAVGALSDAKAMHAMIAGRVRTSLYGIEDSRLVPLVLEVCGEAFGQVVDLDRVPTRGEPTYDRLRRLWQSPNVDELGKTLAEACDVHTERSGDHTDGETFEFWEQTSQVYAAEILMILRLRMELDLPLPVVEHPLLSGPLGRALRSSAEYTDELLTRLRERASEIAPELQARE